MTKDTSNRSSLPSLRADLGVPQRMPFHWLYFILLLFGIVSSLWLHGHPVYTVVLIGLIIPCSLAGYIPYKYFTRNQRFYVMAGFALSGVAWGVFRLAEKVPIDKLLIESICLLALSFSFSPRRRDYGYILLIAVLLLLYGSLLPRAIYLYLVPMAFLLGMTMIYGTRPCGLSGDPDISAPVFRYSWGKILIHLGLVILLWMYFYALMPKDDSSSSSSSGLFITSFRNQNETYMPPQITEWFKSEQVKSGSRGKIASGAKPTSLGHRGSKVKSDAKQGMKSSGNGASPPGKDLVFRVQCPVKLYRLGQIYDQYNGELWTASDVMTRQRKIRKNDCYSRSIPQRITIEKWVSSVLYSAYRADYIANDLLQKNIYESNFFQFKLKERSRPPAVPFSYVVYSEIESTEVIKRRNNMWMEYVRPTHYLQLPAAKITPRLRQLAAQLTDGITDPYRKAMTLRDYLRNNFKYEMLSQRTPPDREAVDYFLFELKAGHCEYFASSLAVLARLCNLPARVATGFSPGNYNALTKTFEVYEYHAHAWTQIYIEEFGWLTFDPTPPGFLITQTYPVALGRFYEPFGNEWKVNPPELAMRVQELATPGWISGKKEDGEITETMLDKILYDVVMLPETVGAMMDRLMAAYDKKNDKGFSFKKFFHQIRTDMEKYFSRLKKRANDMKVWLEKHWLRTSLCLLGIIAFMLLLPRMICSGMRQFDLWRCRRWRQRAESSAATMPDQSILYSYRTVRKLLEHHRYPRERNVDLLDYAALILAHDRQLGVDVLAVFFIYNQLEYSQSPPTVSQARTALARLIRIDNSLHRRR